MKHLARTLTFDVLYSRLQEEIDAKRVNEIKLKDLSLFTYTKQCVYDRLWNKYNMIARGLILDVVNKKVVATPFPKFFNYGEEKVALPNKPFEAYEKYDGSLGIAFYYQDQWYVTTRGSLSSEQGEWGTNKLRALNLTALDIGTTYLFELIYPKNKIVINYASDKLVLLGAYNQDGYELSYSELVFTAARLNVDIAQRYQISSITQAVEIANTLDKENEGFVIRFQNGYRIKIKGEEYLQYHKLIQNITPLNIWESIKDDKAVIYRQEIPEEYWEYFDSISDALMLRYSDLLTQVETMYKTTCQYSDKELGLLLSSFPEPFRKFIFPRHKQDEAWYNNPHTRNKIFEVFKPKHSDI